MAGEKAAMPEPGDFYLKTVRDCFEALKTSENGLSNPDAQKRLAQYGENQLVTLAKTPKWLQFLLQ
ncbi:MAG: cation-transporting P-type ATPase, partial [Candidatus Bathyarchaeota archaeon]|nr:cation-transporting P-type ATPase [Candidatus Bathyarchaeota archaeon]